MLTEQHGRRIAAIENEFGDIGIDNNLVINADQEVFAMNNGCSCCTVRGDLIRILGTLMERREKFDAILIETTGLADPAPVAQTFFVDDEMQQLLRLDGGVTAVDARHMVLHPDESSECREQNPCADVVILNRCDLVSESDLAACERRIRGVNAMATIHRAVKADVPIATVLDIGGFDLSRALQQKSTFLEPEYPFEWGGIYTLPAGTHALRFEPGPDPSIIVLALPVAGDDAAPLALSTLTETAARRWAYAAIPFGTGGRLATGDTPDTLELSGRGPWDIRLALMLSTHIALFTERGPDGFAMTLTMADVGAATPDLEHAYNPAHEHDDTVTSVGIELPGGVDESGLNRWLGRLLAERCPDIFRRKGILHVRDRGERFVFQGVHLRFDGILDRPCRQDEPRRNQLVFIGRVLDREALTAGFAACLA
jgi:G3E family GTPase